MSTEFDEYRDKYQCMRMARSDDGVLELTFNTNGGSLVWGVVSHREFPQAFSDVAADRKNRVVILTGAGNGFCSMFSSEGAPSTVTSEWWDGVYWEGKKLLENLLSIEVPIIAAVNGPAIFHAELAVLSDIVLAADTAVFQDKPHFLSHVVPGDGVQFVWQMLLGVNRGRYFLLTGQQIDAQEAKTLGIVSEVLPPNQLMARARVIASDMAQRPDLTLRYTRVAMVQHIRRVVLQELGYGLALEGLAQMQRR